MEPNICSFFCFGLYFLLKVAKSVGTRELMTLGECKIVCYLIVLQIISPLLLRSKALKYSYDVIVVSDWCFSSFQKSYLVDILSKSFVVGN